MRGKLLFVFSLFCFSASAQIYDSTTLRNYINANIVPNSTRAITAAQLNNSLIGLLNISQRYKVDSIWKKGDSIIYSIAGKKTGFVVANGQAIDSARISNDTLFLHKNTGVEVPVKLGFYTTAQSDARYLQKVDTASLSARIAAKVNIADTASMLGAYLRKGDTASLSNRINLSIPLSQKAANNGVAPLGPDGKVPAAYLQSGAQVYKGTWNASTNSPTLIDGTGTAGWTYRVVGDTATRDLGSGNITFAPGDDVIYNGVIWQRNPNGSTVSSVNGKQGAVVLNTDDVSEGTINRYFTNARVNAAETDPGVPAYVKAITATNISNWNTAFGWGNHASAGYITGTAADARYPLLSGNYSNPAWLSSLPWSKITGAPAFITGNQTITVTGDATGFGTTALPLTLKNTGTAGTYTKVTTDAQGRVTSGTGIDTVDIPTFSKKVRPLFSGAGPVTFGNTTGIIGWNGTTSNVPEGANLYWTNVRGDARYPLLSGAYANPSWLTSLQWSKITSPPTTLAGYGITDAAPATGSGNYVQSQITGPQSSANLWLSGQGNMQRLATSAATAVGQWNMYNGSGQGSVGNLRFVTSLVNAESTGNAGSDYTISRYSDAGALISTALSINRSTGIVNMPSGLKALAVNGSSGLIGNSNTPASVQSYLSYYQADGTTRLGYSGIINGDAYLTADNGNVNLRPGGSNAVFSLAPTILTLSTRTLSLGNTISNFLTFNTYGVAAPAFTTRSLGTKIILYDGITSVNADYGIGVESSHIWNSVSQSSATLGFKWYGGTTLAARLGATGQFETGGQVRAQGWYVAGANNWNGPAAELGYASGLAQLIGYDRTSNYYTPLALSGGSNSSTQSTIRIDDDINFSLKTGQNAFFNVGGANKVTVSKDGILSVGIPNPSTIRASPLQVQGNIWSTDAYLLGTGNSPVGEFGLGGTADIFVRTMGTGSINFQTNAGTVRATVNGSTGNFEIANQVKIAGGTPGAGKVLTSDASGLATWSSGKVPAIRSITASYTATAEDRTIINRAATGTPTLTLPSASTNVGREYVIVEESANPTANGLVFSPGVVYRGTTYTSWVNAVLSSTTRITVQSDGTNWIIISQP